MGPFLLDAREGPNLHTIDEVGLAGARCVAVLLDARK